MNFCLLKHVFGSCVLTLAVLSQRRSLARPLQSLKPIFPNFFSSVALTWIVASGALAAAGHPEGGDGRGLSIKLEIPWTTYKVGETFVFRYTLQNASDKPVPIAIPITRMGLRHLTGGQAFLEGFRTGGRKVENPTYDINKAKWPPRTEVDEEPQAWTWLPPGQQLTWNQNSIWPDYYGVGCFQSFEGFRAHWLIGPSRWISSNPIKVEIVSVPQSEWTELFKVQWVSTGYGAGPQETIIYRIPIKEHWYLFSNGWTRITKVEPTDQFEYSTDKDDTNLEITIKGATDSRKVYFHLAQGYTGDTPWPVGPVSIFNPKPEPIPPAELASLRKNQGLAPDGSVLPDVAQSGNGENKSETGMESDVRKAFGAWRWIVMVALGFGCLLLIFRLTWKS